MRPLDRSLQYLAIEELQLALNDIDKYHNVEFIGSKDNSSYDRKHYLKRLKVNAEFAENWIKQNKSHLLGFRWCASHSGVNMKYFNICYRLAQKGKYKDFISLPEKYRNGNYGNQDVMRRQRKINNEELLRKEGVIC